MSSRFVLGAAMAGCLAVGFGLGWVVHPLPTVLATSAIVPVSQERAVVAAPVKDLAPTNPKADVAAPRFGDVAEHQRAFAWLRDCGMNLQVPPWQSPLIDELDPLFVRIYALSPAEVSRLEASLKVARQQYETLLESVATTSLNADGTQLTVEVPAVPERGGAIRDSLLSAFEQVLGPERFELFGTISGNLFERSFDRFGLNGTAYTMTLKPVSKVSQGFEIYEYVKKSIDAEGRWTSYGTSRLPAAEIKKVAPVLGHFLPADLGQTGKP